MPMLDIAGARALIGRLLSEKRRHHSECVAACARELAVRWGADPEKAELAGLLHDLCKEEPKARQLQILHDSAIMTDNELRLSPAVWHGPAAAELLAEQGLVRDAAVLDAIRWHTLAREGMSLLEEIVYLADLASADRSYPDVDEMRRLTLVGIPEAMGYALQYAVGDLAAKGRPICRHTIEAYNHYAALRHHEKEEKH